MLKLSFSFMSLNHHHTTFFRLNLNNIQRLIISAHLASMKSNRSLPRFFLLAAVAMESNMLAVEGDSYVPLPKMIGDDSTLTSSFDDITGSYNIGDGETIKSKSATFIGICTSDSPFEFVVGGKSGRGVIGAQSTLLHNIAVDIIDPNNNNEGRVRVSRDKIFLNFFTGLATDDSSGFAGLPFKYKKLTSVQGTTVRVTCNDEEDPVDIVAFVEDKQRQVVEGYISKDPGSSDHTLEIVGDMALISKKDLHAESITPVAHGLSRKRNLMNAVKGSASPTSIVLAKSDDEVGMASHTTSPGPAVDITLVQMMIENGDGMLVPRTLPVLTKNGSDDARLRRLERGLDNIIRVQESSIDKNGDVTFKFEMLGMDEEETSLLQARIGIFDECSEEVKHIVDMKAMLSGNEPTLIVHGGWFRRALKMHDINCAWEPVLVNAVTSDPEDGHAVTGHIEQPIHTSIMKDDGDRRLSSIAVNSRRKLLQAMPSPEEIEISDEMKQGRKPEQSMTSSGGRKGESGIKRKLSVNRKKILVHGYCANDGRSPFTYNHFSDAIEFRDPDTSNPQPSNWSHHTFALKIARFAYDNSIDSCGIIAHSQGGPAALYLYTYYFSCLDYSAAGGSRMIQSVGSPYQGSPLGGYLAELGQIFDASCGYNHDLTTSGASNFLSNIPYWSRNQVHFKTTSVKDYWYSWDACSYVTDLLLSDPDDGATEKHRGQLPGGNNRGHTEGLCHTLSMNNPGQTANWSINNEMNINAKY